LAGVADRLTIGDVQHTGVAIPNEEGTEAPASLHYGQVLQGVSALVAPATLLTGIAFYFGWQRVRAFDLYFGLNPAAVGYSTRDYVLNSLDALVLPVMVVLLALMAQIGDVNLEGAERAEPSDEHEHHAADAYIGRVHRRGGNPVLLPRPASLSRRRGLPKDRTQRGGMHRRADAARAAIPAHDLVQRPGGECLRPVDGRGRCGAREPTADAQPPVRASSRARPRGVPWPVHASQAPRRAR
jgi:hypothetical protein